RQRRPQQIDQLGKIPVQRFLVAALEEDLVAVAENERPKSIPLRLEDPIFALRQLADPLGEHRQDRRIHRKIHISCYPAPCYTEHLYIDCLHMDLLQGTLDMLVLKTLLLGPLHGYGVAKAIRTV